MREPDASEAPRPEAAAPPAEAQPAEIPPGAPRPPSADAPEADAPASKPPHEPQPAGTPSAPGRIAVGYINGVWGMRGHVKVTALTSNPARLQADAVVIVRGRPCRIVEVVRPQGYPIIRFEGYPDRTAAERLRDTYIEIEEHELPPLPEDEYYVDDLVGMEVVTTSGDPVGRLAEVLTTGANDVYLVTREGKRDALIPVIGDVVISVDLAARRVVIDPLPGLLD